MTKKTKMPRVTTVELVQMISGVAVKVISHGDRHRPIIRREEGDACPCWARHSYNEGESLK